MSRIAVDSGGVMLSARVDGEAGKPWLLLSNSLAADLTMWDDQMALLTRTHRVLRYDLAGHGDSAPPERRKGTRRRHRKIPAASPVISHLRWRKVTPSCCSLAPLDSAN